MSVCCRDMRPGLALRIKFFDRAKDRPTDEDLSPPQQVKTACLGTPIALCFCRASLKRGERWQGVVDVVSL